MDVGEQVAHAVGDRPAPRKHCRRCVVRRLLPRRLSSAEARERELEPPARYGSEGNRPNDCRPSEPDPGAGIISRQPPRLARGTRSGGHLNGKQRGRTPSGNLHMLRYSLAYLDPPRPANAARQTMGHGPSTVKQETAASAMRAAVASRPSLRGRRFEAVGSRAQQISLRTYFVPSSSSSTSKALGT
jgi:hypothetical protein